MVIVKKNPPNFYDAVCQKCKAEFIYQSDDVQEETTEIEDNPVLNMMIGKRMFVSCPCCNEKIMIGNIMNTGMFGSGCC